MAILTITRGTAGSDTWYLSCAVASEVRSRKPLQPGVISHRGEKPEGRGRHLQRGVADEAERSKVRRESVEGTVRRERHAAEPSYLTGFQVWCTA
ncbi:hypothetical protein TNCV_3438551 [Trichonephila clavipes]|nr:hypothetical protein TNCV_3438551 [Trichonephila clavipes]